MVDDVVDSVVNGNGRGECTRYDVKFGKRKLLEMSSDQSPIFIAHAGTPETPIVFIGVDETVSIGRDPATCSVVLPPDTNAVSRTHCSISHKLDNNGKLQPTLLLTDKSSFGTTVNGKPMQKRGQRTINVGDSIAVGACRFVVGKASVVSVSRKRVLSQRNSCPDAGDSCTVVDDAAAAVGASLTASDQEAPASAAKRPKMEPISQQAAPSAGASWLCSALPQSADHSQSHSQVAANAVEMKEEPEEEELMDSYPIRASQDWTVDDINVGKRLEAFQFVNLVQKEQKMEPPSQIGTEHSIPTSNFKKFRKVHQGGCAKPDTLPVIVGLSDMIDFRSLPAPS